MRPSVANQLHKLAQKSKDKRSFYDYKPPEWTIRDLKLIDPELTVNWSKWIDRWVIYCQGEPSHIVQNPDGSFRQLDQRILRKLRFDNFLTHNAEAYEAYLDQDHHALAKHIAGGLDGVRDYLELKVGE